MAGCFAFHTHASFISPSSPRNRRRCSCTVVVRHCSLSLARRPRVCSSDRRLSLVPASLALDQSAPPPPPRARLQHVSAAAAVPTAAGRVRTTQHNTHDRGKDRRRECACERVCRADMCVLSSSVPSLPLSSVPFGQSQSRSSPSQSGRPYSPGALDVLNADRARAGQAIVKGMEDVRLRDSLSAEPANSNRRASQSCRNVRAQSVSDARAPSILPVCL